MPLNPPPAPTLARRTPRQLTVAWTPIEGEATYRLLLRNRKGKERSFPLTASPIRISRLLPNARYELSVEATRGEEVAVSKRTVAWTALPTPSTGPIAFYAQRDSLVTLAWSLASELKGTADAHTVFVELGRELAELPPQTILVTGQPQEGVHLDLAAALGLNYYFVRFATTNPEISGGQNLSDWSPASLLFRAAPIVIPPSSRRRGPRSGFSTMSARSGSEGGDGTGGGDSGGDAGDAGDAGDGGDGGGDEGGGNEDSGGDSEGDSDDDSGDGSDTDGNGDSSDSGNQDTAGGYAESSEPASSGRSATQRASDYLSDRSDTLSTRGYENSVTPNADGSATYRETIYDSEGAPVSEFEKHFPAEAGRGPGAGPGDQTGAGGGLGGGGGGAGGGGTGGAGGGYRGATVGGPIRINPEGYAEQTFSDTHGTSSEAPQPAPRDRPSPRPGPTPTSRPSLPPEPRPSPEARPSPAPGPTPSPTPRATRRADDGSPRSGGSRQQPLPSILTQIPNLEPNFARRIDALRERFRNPGLVIRSGARTLEEQAGLMLIRARQAPANLLRTYGRAPYAQAMVQWLADHPAATGPEGTRAFVTILRTAIDRDGAQVSDHLVAHDGLVRAVDIRTRDLPPGMAEQVMEAIIRGGDRRLDERDAPTGPHIHMSGPRPPRPSRPPRPAPRLRVH